MECSTNQDHNLGAPDNRQEPRLIKQIILFNGKEADGDDNVIAEADVTTKSNLVAKIQASTDADRWQCFRVDNPEVTNNEAITEELSDGAILFVRDGTYVFSGMLKGYGPAIIRAFENWRTRANPVAMFVDVEGSLVFRQPSGDTNCYGIPIEPGSIVPDYNWATGDANAGVMISMQSLVGYSKYEQKAICYTDFDESLTDLFTETVRSVVTPTAVATATATTVTIKTETIYGEGVSGLVVGDVTMTDGSGAVTPTSFTASSDNKQYTLVYPSSTSPLSFSIDGLSKTYDIPDFTLTF